MATATFERYSHHWKAGTRAIDIEKWCIRQGKDLFTHYRALHSLLWEDEHNKWSDLALREFTDCVELRKRGMVGLLGPGSSGKTYYASKFVLSHYYVYPEETTILLTTTTVQKLDLGILGEVKKLHKQAKARWDDLPGVALDYKRCIITDRSEDGDTRDFRNGVIGIACFLPGTLVDTPSGPKPIETLRVGDKVFNASGIGTITETHTRIVDRAFRVHLSDGRMIDCTEEHPFFTQRGWVKVRDLETYDRVFSVHETLRLLQGELGTGLSQPKVLLKRVPHFPTTQKLRSLPEAVSPVAQEQRPIRSFLRYGLRGTMGSRTQRLHQESVEGVQELRATNESCASQPRLLLSAMPQSPGDDALSAVWEGFCFAARIAREGQDAVLRSILQAEVDFQAAPSQGQDADARGTNHLEAVSRRNVEPLRQERLVEGRRQTTRVQGGRGFSNVEVRRGNRRRHSSDSECGNEGQIPRQPTQGAWVDRVEILKQEGDERYDAGQGGYRVHNLEVAGHPSYSVNGVIVHNCYKGEHWVGIGPFVGIKNKWVFLVADECSLMHISYLRATSNLDKNERFFFIPIANPVNGEHSPMGQSCEPELGWGSVRDITKTTIWPTKYAKGKCINFVGTDSPNFEGDGRHYPFLIDQERIDSTLRFYGPHSEEFNAMCLGIMRPGEDSQRVLTKQLCTIHKAFEKATWKGVNRTKIYSVDAAYGGDRCVGGWIEFGDDVDGKQIVRVEKPHVIKIGMKRGAEPEDEIAEHVRDECLREGIPVENVFYDSTGRGTLGAAFARVFGHVIPVPVEFGGRPSARPVRLDLFVVDQHTQQRRLKRADEEYQKRVSEFWFAVRWLVESEQLRELPESVAQEFFMREFIFVGGNKRDVEPKDKTKQRIGRSPDEADWLATAVEGARQRGLQIAKLGADKFIEGGGKSWLEELNDRHRKLIASMRLKTAA